MFQIQMPALPDMTYCQYFHFPGLEFIELPEIVEGLSSEGREDNRILKILETYIGKDDWK